jgi:uncharacterized membrane protein
MFKKLAFLLLLNLLITNTSKAAEITNVEWDVLRELQVTVYEPSAKDLSYARCTAFYIPEDNKPIGGDTAFYRAGISQVTISVPNSYRGKDLKNFEITCK